MTTRAAACSTRCNGANVDAYTSRCVPVYSPAVTGTHYTYPCTDCQAELTWVVGSAPRWFTCAKTVTHLGTNRARRSITLFEFDSCTCILIYDQYDAHSSAVQMAMSKEN